jgi:hypothetical protein
VSKKTILREIKITYKQLGLVELSGYIGVLEDGKHHIVYL